VQVFVPGYRTFPERLIFDRPNKCGFLSGFYLGFHEVAHERNITSGAPVPSPVAPASRPPIGRTHPEVGALPGEFRTAAACASQSAYGARRSVSVSLWKSVWSRKRSQPLSFLAVCATLFFSPVAKSSHEL
jgi:hypothetical protein